MKTLLIVLCIILSTPLLYGQEKRINLYGAYVFDDSFDTYYSSTEYFTGKITGGFQWGAGIEFKPSENVGLELLYHRQDTDVPISNHSSIITTSRTLDVSCNYILLGLNRYVVKDKIEPYGGLVLGAAIFNNDSPQSGDETSVTKFAVGGRLGINVWASEKVAIKLQALLLTAVQGAGGGFFFGTGGASAGVSTYSTITQLSLGGGLSFKIGQ